jgi:electron transfer flavoprotein alpha subunit
MSQDIFVVVEHLQSQLAPITYVMLAAGRALAQGAEGKVVGILMGHNTQDLVETMAADQVLYVDHPNLAEFTPDAYTRVLAELIEGRKPKAVLLGSTSIGSDLASTLSERLNLPIVSSCIRISPNGTLTSQICGGKILAEFEVEAPTTLITIIPGGYRLEEGQSESMPDLMSVDPPSLDDLQITLSRYIEPEVGDVDVTKEDVLIAVGRGIQNLDNIELAEELASALGGELCASRPVVDQGWMSSSRLIGKSGKTVKPKLFIALGISGAPEHVEGITESEMIIAINTDPAAPIFDVAKYGVELDMFDLLDLFIERVEEAKDG